MKYHFASCEVKANKVLNIKKIKPRYILGSFHYLNKKSEEELIEYFSYIHSSDCKQFILDSGAFTYMFGSEKQKKEIVENTDEYIEKYSNFIKRWKCKNYIELDIDVIVGYEKVKKITEKLEKIVGYKAIPVFHNRFRNKQDLDDMLKKYSYIGISNFNGKKDRSIFKNIKAIVRYAKQKNVKVHGLALTGKRITKEIPEFYSIDSSSWTSGLRFGNIPIFDKKTNSIKVLKNTTNKKLKLDSRGKAKINEHAMKEWKKYAEYLERGDVWI